MKSKPPACAGCPAEHCGRSFVPFRGPEGAELLILGQGPGETEANLGSPFIGPSGQRLSVWARLAGVDLTGARIGNVCQCWLPDNRPPSPRERAWCREAHWGRELKGRRVVVPVGVPAMAEFYPKAGESTAGQWAAADGHYVCGILHPSFILRGNFGLEPLQIQILRSVADVLAGGEPRIYDFTRLPDGVDAQLFPDLAELRRWGAEFQPGDEVALDVEAAGSILRMVGMMRVRDESYRAVWFRTEGGDPWPWPDLAAVVEWLYDFLADARMGKVFHNGAYDIVDQLEEVGFEVNGYCFDTLLATHIAYPEMRKRLERVALLTGGFTGWKGVLRDTEADQK